MILQHNKMKRLSTVHVALVAIVLCGIFLPETAVCFIAPSPLLPTTTTHHAARSNSVNGRFTASTTKKGGISETKLWDKMDDDDYMVVQDEGEADRRNLIINIAAAGLLAASGYAAWDLFRLTAYTPDGFTRISPTKFIAALGDPKAQQGTFGGADTAWGVWRQDPGPRGVWLKDYQKELQETNGIAPRGWRFNEKDYWVEEHGLIMESPTFPLPDGRYLVTGGRSVTTGLTVDNGSWKLDEGTLYDVTHLPCRSARYNPVADAADDESNGSPASARLSDFPVKPGAVMPTIPGTNKQDYAVLFIIGKAV